MARPARNGGEPERQEWLAAQSIRRSYAQEVVEKIEHLGAQYEIEQYGALPVSPDQYPLFIVHSRKPDSDNPYVLVTGGVHGYETSGVQGAIRFLQTTALDYLARFNLLVAPCVSPWGYETINRWNAGAIDPNRSFYTDSPAEEAAALMRYIHGHSLEFLVHIDLHETTDTDNSEFRPALSARDAVAHENWHIPDGFYTVGDTEKPAPGFQGAIIASVEKVTHIAPPASDGKIIGETVEQWGVINYQARKQGLCMGMTDAQYATTTEVYPDSPEVNDENCTDAQVAAVKGGLDYVAGQFL